MKMTELEASHKGLAHEVQLRLEERYGAAQWTSGNDPMDELVSCILSQHNSDINTGRAFASLKRRFPTWEEALAAPVEELVESIRHGGLANTKAPRIQGVLRRILEDQGALNLNCLEAMTDAEARAYLLSLPGVGPKTAAIVLSFALGRPMLAVDTHIFRVSWRLGLIEKKIGADKAHDALQVQVSPEKVYRFHVALITHGRQVCKAPTPRCGACCLTDLCRTYLEGNGSVTTADSLNKDKKPEKPYSVRAVKQIGSEPWRTGKIGET